MDTTLSSNSTSGLAALGVVAGAALSLVRARRFSRAPNLRSWNGPNADGYTSIVRPPSHRRRNKYSRWYGRDDVLRFEVPGWFKEDSAVQFRELPLKDDDVVLCTFPKCGTTWVWKILHSLLRMDDDGELPSSVSDKKHQAYFEALPKDPPAEPERPFGRMTYPELVAQPSPRLFSSHMTPAFLPRELEKKGRLVYVLRDPKDACVSLHYMLGLPKDGWDGNEHGPGSFKRFIDPETVNAFGSFFDHVTATEPMLRELGGVEGTDAGTASPRAIVLYYPDLKANLDGELRRLATFLGIPLTGKKLAAVKARVAFKAMKDNSGGMGKVLLRSGKNGDWQTHFSPAQGEEFKRVYEERLGSSALAKTLAEKCKATWDR